MVSLISANTASALHRQLLFMACKTRYSSYLLYLTSFRPLVLIWGTLQRLLFAAFLLISADVPGFIRFKDIKLMIYWQYKAHHLPLSSAEKLETLSDFAWGKKPFDYKLSWSEFRDTCVAQPFTFML
jgi:hypothetical protein